MLLQVRLEHIRVEHCGVIIRGKEDAVPALKEAALLRGRERRPASLTIVTQVAWSVSLERRCCTRRMGDHTGLGKGEALRWSGRADRNTENDGH